MKKIAIFASGSGTNAENIAKYFQGHPEIEVSLIVTNRAKAQVVERANRLGITCLHFPKDEWAQGRNVLLAMHEHNIDLIVLAGFLAMVPDALINAYPRGIINIHPSLLPKYGGKGMYGDHVHEAVIANREAESGITIHYVDAIVDGGDAIAQFRCPVLADDTPATLASRVHGLEYAHYPEIIEQLLSQGF